jgi:hypothetical protein
MASENHHHQRFSRFDSKCFELKNIPTTITSNDNVFSLKWNRDLLPKVTRDKKYFKIKDIKVFPLKYQPFAFLEKHSSGLLPSSNEIFIREIKKLDSTKDINLSIWSDVSIRLPKPFQPFSSIIMNSSTNEIEIILIDSEPLLDFGLQCKIISTVSKQSFSAKIIKKINSSKFILKLLPKEDLLSPQQVAFFQFDNLFIFPPVSTSIHKWLRILGKNQVPNKILEFKQNNDNLVINLRDMNGDLIKSLEKDPKQSDFMKELYYERMIYIPPYTISDRFLLEKQMNCIFNEIKFLEDQSATITFFNNNNKIVTQIIIPKGSYTPTSLSETISYIWSLQNTSLRIVCLYDNSYERYHLFSMDNVSFGIWFSDNLNMTLGYIGEKNSSSLSCKYFSTHTISTVNSNSYNRYEISYNQLYDQFLFQSTSKKSTIDSTIVDEAISVPWEIIPNIAAERIGFKKIMKTFHELKTTNPVSEWIIFPSILYVTISQVDYDPLLVKINPIIYESEMKFQLFWNHSKQSYEVDTSKLSKLQFAPTNDFCFSFSGQFGENIPSATFFLEFESFEK